MLRRVAILTAVALIVMGAGCLETLQNIRNDTTPPGGSARDYLTNAKYTKLIVEIDYPTGSAPNSEAVSLLKQTLQQVTPKTSIEIVQSQGLTDFPKRGENGKYSIQEIKAFEDANRDHYPGGDTAVMYIIYVDGGSTDDNGNARVLGAHYLGTSIVMYKGNIKHTTRSDNSLLPGFSATERCLERAVIVHEAGHALGLVNNGIPMQTPHSDAPEHPHHSNNKKSVMYWAVENSQSLRNAFSGGCDSIPYQFDENDKADMRAVREGRA